MGIKDVGAVMFKIATADFTETERKALSKVLVKLNWRALIAYHILWSCGLLAAFGMGGGFAKADDVRNMIQKETVPLAAAIGKLSLELNQQIELNKRREARALESDIRHLASKLCVATQGDRDRLYHEVDAKQEDYETLRGRRYAVPACADL